VRKYSNQSAGPWPCEEASVLLLEEIVERRLAFGRLGRETGLRRVLAPARREIVAEIRALAVADRIGVRLAALRAAREVVELTVAAAASVGVAARTPIGAAELVLLERRRAAVSMRFPVGLDHQTILSFPRKCGQLRRFCADGVQDIIVLGRFRRSGVDSPVDDQDAENAKVD